MRKITLKRISLVNFKGIRNLDITFNDDVTTISGKNASGKTTVFDAFTWLLFGKNAEDKKQFGIKTIGEDGNPIPRLEHEVSAELDVDGESITIRRCLTEKWQKRRGSAEEEFKGNEESRFYNDVPMSVKDWSEKINSIVDEDTFKMLTNPMYFTSMKWQSQREMLIQMAGDVTDKEICDCNPESFTRLLDALNGKSLDEFKKEIGAKKARIKADVETLPSRIDERRRSEGNDYDFNLISARLHHKQGRMNDIDKRLKELTKASAVSTASTQLAKDMAEVQRKIMERENEIRQQMMKENYKMETDRARTTSAINFTDMKIKSNDDDIEKMQNAIPVLKNRRESLLNEWKEIKARSLQFSEGDFTCPTCGRVLEPSQIESKQEEMITKFNEQKAIDLEQNKELGMAVKAKLDEVEKRLAEVKKQNEDLTNELTTLQSQLAMMPKPITEEAILFAIENDESLKVLKQGLAEVKASQDKMDEDSADESRNVEIETLSDERKALQDEIAELQGQLALKQVSEANEKRIEELEKQLKQQNEELAKLEGIEFTIQEFTKARIELLEGKINALFQFVKFKMFDTQINGGEVETCKAMVDGVVYDDLNHAMKINAGLDIINGIYKVNEVSAPIFIDNAEAVNKLIETFAQTIRLVVSEDEKLTIS